MSITFLKKYRVIEKIGEGTFSEVLKCQNKTTGVFYAGKKLKRVYESINEITDSPEVIAMKKISRHPNILYMIEYHHDPLPGKLTLIFELMEMSLYDLIRNRKGLKITEQRVRLYIYQLLKGLDHLHKHGIFHRDIKPENILVKGVVVKLADLGSVRGIYSRPPYTEYISTRWYRSPECLLTTGYYGPKMDIWALGCVYYELLELKPLFPGTDEIDQIFKIHNVLGSPHPRLITRLRRQSRNFECAFPIKSGCGIASLVSTLSDYGKDLMKLMLTYDPDNRCSAKRLLEHRSFYELRENDLERMQINSRQTNPTPEASQWRNPVLLSYMTSEKRRGSRSLSTRKPKHNDDDVLKVPKIVESTPNARAKLNSSSIKINDNRNADKSWRRNSYSMKNDRLGESPRSMCNFNTKLPVIKYNSLNKNSDITTAMNKRGISKKMSEPYLSQFSLREKNNFYPNFMTKKISEASSKYSFLPELINKPRRPVPSAPLTSSSFQQINNANETKKKTKLSTINETKRSIIHRASPNLSSPAKKIPKHESLSSFSSKKLSIFSSKRI